MAWIESHTGQERHPKILQLKAAMRWSKNEALGFVHRFRWTVLEFAPSGGFVLSDEALDAVTPALPMVVMSEMLETPLEMMQQAFDAMCQFGLIDKHGEVYLVHDWLDYAGRYLSETKYKTRQDLLTMVKRMHESVDNPRIVQGKSTVPNQPNQPNHTNHSPGSDDPGPVKPKPQKPRKPPSGDHAEAIRTFCEAWEKRYGVPYSFANAKDGAAVKWMLAQGGLPVYRIVVAAYLRSDDAFVAQQRHPLSLLRSQWNRWKPVVVKQLVKEEEY